MFDQAVGLLVHFCHKLNILLLFCAWFALSALAGLRYPAALHHIGGCPAGIELFVVAFKLLALADRAFILPGFARETLRAALPA